MTLPNGDWSIAELVDLLRAYDYNFGQLGDHYDAFKEQWAASDPQAFGAWTGDWTDLQSRYQLARAAAQRAIDVAGYVLSADNLIDAQTEYVAVLRAYKQVDGKISTGDFDDLAGRLQTASGQATNFANEPQPTPGSDYQFEEYLAADKATAVLDAIGDAAKKALPKPLQTLPTWVWPTVAVAAGVFIVAKVKEIL